MSGMENHYSDVLILYPGGRFTWRCHATCHVFKSTALSLSIRETTADCLPCCRCRLWWSEMIDKWCAIGRPQECSTAHTWCENVQTVKIYQTYRTCSPYCPKKTVVDVWGVKLKSWRTNVSAGFCGFLSFLIQMPFQISNYFLISNAQPNSLLYQGFDHLMQWDWSSPVNCTLSSLWHKGLCLCRTNSGDMMRTTIGCAHQFIMTCWNFCPWTFAEKMSNYYYFFSRNEMSLSVVI